MDNSGNFVNQCHLKWFPYCSFIAIAMRGGYPMSTNELDTVMLTLPEQCFRYLITSSNLLMASVERGHSVPWSLIAL